mmetsp:Transcript_149544/g.372278  ORF Transcript_149544/g.372278 Transcript_149544/m.372278 type:complete len:116 (+) Transcript_149544:3829-4176(+)
MTATPLCVLCSGTLLQDYVLLEQCSLDFPPSPNLVCRHGRVPFEISTCQSSMFPLGACLALNSSLGTIVGGAKHAPWPGAAPLGARAHKRVHSQSVDVRAVVQPLAAPADLLEIV